MRVDVLVPDTAAVSSVVADHDQKSFSAVFDAVAGALARADTSERAFASHRGGLQEMVVDRARADIALQIAATAAQRAAQGLQTILGMQI